MTANGYGLAMWWNLKIVRPKPQPNKNTNDEANKQKPNRITSAETADDSDKVPKLTTSSHHINEPPVSGSLFYPSIKFLGLIIYLSKLGLSNAQKIDKKWVV